MERNSAKVFLVGAAFALCLAPALSNAGDSPKCAKRTDLAGPCYEVHGRLNSWNGGGASERIWVVGTKRMLAVYNRDTGEIVMPQALDDQFKSFWTRIYADFTVCPFEKDVPGQMGYVCIASAKNILVERHSDPEGKDKGTYTKVSDIKGE